MTKKLHRRKKGITFVTVFMVLVFKVKEIARRRDDGFLF